MLYNLRHSHEIEMLKSKLEALIAKRSVVELVEKKPKRAISQNSYLHLLLAYFACETGNSLEYVKTEYFKKLVNPDYFKVEVEDKYKGKIVVLRSSSQLDTAEMTTCIERFKMWSAKEAGVYLPDADEHDVIIHVRQTIDNHKQFC